MCDNHSVEMSFAVIAGTRKRKAKGKITHVWNSGVL